MSSPHAPFEAQLAEHMPRLQRVARALCASDRRGDADADDLVQDTLERVLRRPRAIHGEPAAYLLQALRRTHVDRHRARLARPATVPPPAGFDPPDHDRLHTRRQADELLRAVGRLPAPYRDAVVALDLVGLTTSEAAAAAGVPPGTVTSRASRGRARVVAELGG